MARIYIVSSRLFVPGRLFTAARLEEERDDLIRQQAALESRLARQWKELYDKENCTDAVPALQEGTGTDRAWEVPAAPVVTGATLSDVESEGGAID